jgi:hypothetical protein
MLMPYKTGNTPFFNNTGSFFQSGNLAQGKVLRFVY